jgi:16S rRNA processing protein RimM
LSSSTDHINVGRIGKPHGLDGASTVLPASDDPGRFVVGAVFSTDSGLELTIKSVKPYRDRGLLVHFAGYRSRTQAESLRGTTLLVDASERRTLDAGEFWAEDLVGLTAHDPQGATLGTVDRVELGPGQDRLVIRRSDGTEVLVPFVSEIVSDPTDDSLTIDAPDGLFS